MKSILIEEYDLMLAGTQYLDKNNNRRYYNAEGSRKGSVFDLFHEKDNEYDPLAIIVFYKGKEIGYIPKDENLEIAYYLSHPEWFHVECRQKKKQVRRDYEMIVVIVQIFAIVEDYIPFSFENFDKEFPNYDDDVEILKKVREEKEQIEKEKRKERAEKKRIQDKKDTQKGCFIISLVMVVFILLFYLNKDKFSENEISESKKNYAKSDYSNPKTDTLAVLNQRQMEVNNDSDEIKNAYKILKSDHYYIDTEVIRFTALYNKFRNTEYANILRKTRDSLSLEQKKIMERVKKELKNKKK